MIKKTALNLIFVCLIAILMSPMLAQASTRLNGKKVIFIGNSFLYYGGCTSKGKQRQEDSGQFKKICELYGDTVSVTDCTYGNHGLDDFSESGCKADNCSSGTGCAGNGTDLLRDLDLGSYDIVFFSEAGENPSAFWSRWTTLKKRFTKPTVEFYYLSHTYSYINNHTNIINNFDNFEDAGVKVLEWGRIATELYGGNKAPGNMTPARQGKLAIPNSAVTYSKTSFIKNKNDSHHPNPLSGYMAAMMAYCAASNTLAQGMRYDFVNDVINIDSYISSHYSSSSSTNMKQIFASEADMQGLQALMDICVQHGIFDYDVKYNGFYFKVDDAARVTCERYTKLTGDLTIPSTVEYNSASYLTREITPYAFYAHSGLTSIVIPETVESVGNHAFQGCDGLKSVTCQSTIPPVMPDDAFTTYTTTTLTVPAGTKALYASALGWRNFTNIVEDASTIDPGLGDEYLKSSKSSFTLAGGYGAPEQPYVDIEITGNNLTTDITCNPSIGAVTASTLDGWSALTGGTLRLTLNTNYSSGIGTYSGYVAVQSTSSHRIEIPFTVSLYERVTNYTINYNANGGQGAMASSTHIQGVESKLSSNTFTRTGYSFGGWNAHRASDGTWYYLLANGTTGWYKKGFQPVDAVLTTFANGATVSDMTNASADDGDTITLYAYWNPNVTATKTYYVRYDANGGAGSMEETPITYGASTKTRDNAFVREGYTFVGWTPYRHNKAQWGYKNISTFGDKWLGGSESKDGYIFKTYAEGASIGTTTSVDADIVTFYAAWASVVDGVMPQNVAQGSDFEMGGKLACTTDLYGFVVSIKNTAGEVVQTYAVETFANRTALAGGVDLAQANSSLDFATLAEGSYTLEVQAQVIASTTPFNITVYSSTFIVGEGVPSPPVEPETPDNVINDNITALTEEWNYSEVSGNTANWITNGSQVTQDMALNDGKLYVVHRTGSNSDNKIYIVDAYTGTKTGELNTSSCAVGTYFISTIETFGGKVIAANLAASGSEALTIYSWDSDSAEPTVLLSTTDHNNVRVGDDMSVSGDMTNGKIWFAAHGGASVYYYTVKNGVCSSTPTVINLIKNGAAYEAFSHGAAHILEESDGSFWVDAQNLNAARFTAGGEFIEEITTAHFYGTNYKPFALGAKKYATVMTYANKTNTLTEASFQLLNVTDGIETASVIGTYPAASLGSSRNTSFRNSLCYEVGDEKLYIWVLVPFQGAACYSFRHTTSSGVEAILPEENGVPAQYFNMQGMPVANPSNGVYIKVQGNKASKVLIR